MQLSLGRVSVEYQRCRGHEEHDGQAVEPEFSLSDAVVSSGEVGGVLIGEMTEGPSCCEISDERAYAHKAGVFLVDLVSWYTDLAEYLNV